jgi:hypothetical protein
MLVVALLLALAAPAAAVSQGAILSIFAILQILGTLGFAWLAVYSSKDFFLLLGNVVCAFGACVWVFMLLEEEGNPAWIATFTVLGCLSAYAVVVLFKKYRSEGLDSDSEAEDSDADGEPDARRAQRQLATTTANSAVLRDKKRPDAAAARRRKKVS